MSGWTVFQKHRKQGFASNFKEKSGNGNRGGFTLATADNQPSGPLSNCSGLPPAVEMSAQSVQLVPALRAFLSIAQTAGG